MMSVPFFEPTVAMVIMAIQVVEFSNGGVELERFLLNNQHTQMKSTLKTLIFASY